MKLIITLPSARMGGKWSATLKALASVWAKGGETTLVTRRVYHKVSWIRKEGA